MMTLQFLSSWLLTVCLFRAVLFNTSSPCCPSTRSGHIWGFVQCKNITRTVHQYIHEDHNCKKRTAPAALFICHGAEEMELQGLGAVTIPVSSFPYTFVKWRHAKENGEERGPRCFLPQHLPGEPPAVTCSLFHFTIPLALTTLFWEPQGGITCLQRCPGIFAYW